jgi:hypothetical protein
MFLDLMFSKERKFTESFTAELNDPEEMAIF